MIALVQVMCAALASWYVGRPLLRAVFAAVILLAALALPEAWRATGAVATAPSDVIAFFRNPADESYSLWRLELDSPAPWPLE